MKNNIFFSNLLNELRQLQREGTEGIYLQDNTWNYLKTLTQKSTIAKTSTVDVISQPIVSKLVVEDLVTEAVQVANAEVPWIWPSQDVHQCYDFLKQQILQDSVFGETISDPLSVFFGKIDWKSPVLLCAECPHMAEAQAQSIFEGEGGVLLQKILLAIGQPLDQFSLAYILPWVLKNPEKGQLQQPSTTIYRRGLYYFTALIDLLKPQVVVVFGSKAMEVVFSDIQKKITECRGEWMNFQQISTMVTYAPSYLIHNGTLRVKRQFWEDVLKVMEYLKWPISEKQRDFFKSQ